MRESAGHRNRVEQMLWRLHKLGEDAGVKATHKDKRRHGAVGDRLRGLLAVINFTTAPTTIAPAQAGGLCCCQLHWHSRRPLGVQRGRRGREGARAKLRDARAETEEEALDHLRSYERRYLGCAKAIACPHQTSRPATTRSPAKKVDRLADLQNALSQQQIDEGREHVVPQFVLVLL